MTQEERDWIDVILGLYSDLPLSNGVIRHTDSNDKKRKRIMDYLNQLRDYSERCFKNRYSRFEHIYKTIFYYNNYIIKAADIPESYYDAQIKISRENGMGDLILTDAEKQQIARRVISDQKASLDEWINYFVHGNGRFFPIYEQYWAFQGLQKLGKYDSTTGKFSKRNKNTVYPFPYLNEAALEMTITLMENFVRNHIIIPGLENAFNSYNFKALYEYSLKEVLKKQTFKSNNGQWHKYDQGSDYHVLLSDLRGKHTGWCTERSSWAEKYLSESDFYVFYTEDIYGNFTNPRITIRAAGKDIKEIRGIASHQNIESEMVPILNEKLKEFDFSDDFFDKQKDMQMLTLIEAKNRDGVELSKDELIFLYEINHLIEGFGGDKDPRILKIIKKRNIKHDLQVIFDIDEKNIAMDISQINSDTKVFFGDIVYEIEDDKILLKSDEYDDFGLVVHDINVPDFVLGNLSLPYLDSVKLPKIVTGNFDIFCPKFLNELVLPQVNTHLSVYGLANAKKIFIPNKTCYDINFYGLNSCDEIIFPEKIKGSLNMPNMTFASNSTLPRVVKQDVNLKTLMSVKNFKMPLVIGGNLYIDNLFSFDGQMPDKVYGKIFSINIPFNQDKKVR